MHQHIFLGLNSFPQTVACSSCNIIIFEIYFTLPTWRMQSRLLLRCQPHIPLTTYWMTCDTTESRRIIGSLQYLLMTRPDISFCVNMLSQFMHRPTDLRMQAAKRVLQNLLLLYSIYCNLYSIHLSRKIYIQPFSTVLPYECCLSI